MSRKGWKDEERLCAAMFYAKRYPANMGERLDFANRKFIGQVKNVKEASLPMVEALAVEMEEAGKKDSRLRYGVVAIKRSAGAGKKTPRLVIMTEAVWRRIMNDHQIATKEDEILWYESK